jgi:hypothetical protein
MATSLRLHVVANLKGIVSLEPIRSRFLAHFPNSPRRRAFPIRNIDTAVEIAPRESPLDPAGLP